MDLEVRLHLFKRPISPVRTVSVPNRLVRLGFDVLSEHEILDMTAHDRHYATAPPQALPPSATLLAQPFEAATHRTSSKDVIGNVGEGLGIAAVMHLADLRDHEVLRLRRTRQAAGQPAPVQEACRRTPDFAVSRSGTGTLTGTAALRQVIQTLVPERRQPALNTVLSGFPDRFPVEAKGSSTLAKGALWSAAWQLVEYWSSLAIAHGASPEIGYGVAVLTSHIRDLSAAERAIDVHLFVPTNQTNLSLQLQTPPTDREGRKAFVTAFANAFVS